MVTRGPPATPLALSSPRRPPSSPPGCLLPTSTRASSSPPWLRSPRRRRSSPPAGPRSPGASEAGHRPSMTDATLETPVEIPRPRGTLSFLRGSLDWLPVLPFFAYIGLFLLLPALWIALGAFQSDAGCWNLDK